MDKLGGFKNLLNDWAQDCYRWHDVYLEASLSGVLCLFWVSQYERDRLTGVSPAQGTRDDYLRKRKLRRILPMCINPDERE